MASKRSHHTADLALRRRGGLHRADGNPRVARRITARPELAAREVSSRVDAGPLYTRDTDVEKTIATMAKEHDRAERRLGAALAERHRSSERYDAAVGGSARLLAAVGLRAADQEVAARDAWLRWVDDDGGAAHPTEHR
jgi:hypothetical protein